MISELLAQYIVKKLFNQFCNANFFNSMITGLVNTLGSLVFKLAHTLDLSQKL